MRQRNNPAAKPKQYWKIITSLTLFISLSIIFINQEVKSFLFGSLINPPEQEETIKKDNSINKIEENSHVLIPTQQSSEGSSNDIQNTDINDCGNGIIDPEEECDDGNQIDGDGCSSICSIEIDTDQDGIMDKDDNCPNIPNPNQSDIDNDFVGDICDNCEDKANPRRPDVLLDTRLTEREYNDDQAVIAVNDYLYEPIIPAEKLKKSEILEKSDLNGNIHIVWTSDLLGQKEIFYKMTDLNGNIIIPDILISEDDGYKSERPDLGIDNEGSVHIVWQDTNNLMGDSYELIYYAKLNPASFLAVGDISKSSGFFDIDPMPIANFSNEYTTYPRLDIDTLGNVHIVFYASSNQEIYYMQLDNWGNINESPNGIYHLNSGWHPDPSITVDGNNNPHIVFTDYTYDNNPTSIPSENELEKTSDFEKFSYSYEIFYMMLNPNGNIAIDATQISEDFDYSDCGSSRPNLDIDSDGFVHIVWQDWRDCSSDNVEIYYEKLDPGSHNMDGTTGDDNILAVIDDMVISSVDNNGSNLPSIVIDRQNRLPGTRGIPLPPTQIGNHPDVMYITWQDNWDHINYDPYELEKTETQDNQASVHYLIMNTNGDILVKDFNITPENTSASLTDWTYPFADTAPFCVVWSDTRHATYEPSDEYGYGLEINTYCLDDLNTGTQNDIDEDGIGDVCDNCPNTSNQTQIDTDSDNVGDICDYCPENEEQSQSDTIIEGKLTSAPYTYNEKPDVAIEKNNSLSGLNAQYIDNQENIHIVWSQDAEEGSEIHYKMIDSAGNVLIYDTQISIETYYGYSDAYWNTNPTINVDNNGILHITWSALGEYCDIDEEYLGFEVFYTRINPYLDDLNGDSASPFNIILDQKMISEPNCTDSISPTSSLDQNGNINMVWWEFGEEFIPGKNNKKIDKKDFSEYLQELNIDPQDMPPSHIEYMQLNNIGAITIPEHIISNEEVYEPAPEIINDSQNNSHIVWWATNVDELVNQIIYKELDQNGITLINDTIISNNQEVFNFSPRLDIDSEDNIHIVWTSIPDFMGGHNNSPISKSEIEEMEQIIYEKINPAADDQNGDSANDQDIAVIDDLFITPEDYIIRVSPEISINNEDIVYINYAKETNEGWSLYTLEMNINAEVIKEEFELTPQATLYEDMDDYFTPSYRSNANSYCVIWTNYQENYYDEHKITPNDYYDFNELYYYCETPTVCEEISCGDGIINTEEECDDGNIINGDGCSAICEIKNDSDLDLIPNENDNCPLISNPNQQDSDEDGVGDVCDNCPTINNPRIINPELNNIRVTDNDSDDDQAVVAIEEIINFQGLNKKKLNKNNTVEKYDTNGNVHLVWKKEKNNNDEIYYKMINMAGDVLIPETLVSINDGYSSNQPDMIVDYDGNVHIVWQDNNSMNGCTYKSIHYTKLNPSEYGNTEFVEVAPHPFDDFECYTYNSKPRLEKDIDNNIHIVWYEENHEELYYAKLDNNGEILIPSTVFRQADSWFWNPNPNLVVDGNGDVHITFTEYINNYQNENFSKRLTKEELENKNILEKFSDSYEIFYTMLDGHNGEILIDTTQISDNVSETYDCDAEQSNIAIDSDGYVYIVWQDWRDCNNDNLEVYYEKIDPSRHNQDGSPAIDPQLAVINDTQVSSGNNINSYLPTIAIKREGIFPGYRNLELLNNTSKIQPKVGALDTIYITWQDNSSYNYSSLNNSSNDLESYTNHQELLSIHYMMMDENGLVIENDIKVTNENTATSDTNWTYPFSDATFNYCTVWTDMRHQISDIHNNSTSGYNGLEIYLHCRGENDNKGVQPDSDHDTIGDSCDNCISTFNPDQINTDKDLAGDACDYCPNDANLGEGDNILGGRLTENSNYDYMPDIALEKNTPISITDNEENIHIVWSRETEDSVQIFYKLLDNQGNILINETQVSQLNTYGYEDYQNLWPTINIDSQNLVHIVWSSIGEYCEIEDNLEPHPELPEPEFQESSEIFYTIINPYNDDMDGSAAIPENIIQNQQMISNPTCRWAITPRSSLDESNQLHVVWWSTENEYALYAIKNMEKNGTDFKKDMTAFSEDISTINYTQWDHSLMIVPEQELDNGYFYYPSPDIVNDIEHNSHITWWKESQYEPFGGENENSEIIYSMLNPDGITLIDNTRINNNIDEYHLSFMPRIAIDNNGFVHIVWTYENEYSNNESNIENQHLSVLSDIVYQKIDPRLDDQDGSEALDSAIAIIDDKFLSNLEKYDFMPSIAIDNENKIYINWLQEYIEYPQLKQLTMNENGVIIDNISNITPTSSVQRGFFGEITPINSDANSHCVVWSDIRDQDYEYEPNMNIDKLIMNDTGEIYYSCENIIQCTNPTTPSSPTTTTTTTTPIGATGQNPNANPYYNDPRLPVFQPTGSPSPDPQDPHNEFCLEFDPDRDLTFVDIIDNSQDLFINFLKNIRQITDPSQYIINGYNLLEAGKAMYGPENPAYRYEVVLTLLRLNCIELLTSLESMNIEFIDLPFNGINDPQIAEITRAMYTAYNQGIMHGYIDGSIRPFTPVTKAQIWKLVLETFELMPNNYVPPTISIFPDVQTTDWFYKYVNYAHETYEIGTENFNFNPYEPITRADLAEILSIVFVDKYPDFNQYLN